MFVKGQRHPPGEPRGRPGNAQILQRFGQKGEDLVAVPLRGDKLRIVVDMIDEPVLIGGHPKEVILLGDQLRCCLVIGTVAVYQLLFGQEAFTALTIHTGIFTEIDIAAIPHQLEDLLHGPDMVGIGGADNMVWLDGEMRPGLLERWWQSGRRTGGVFLRPWPQPRRFFTVLVGAGLETDLVPAEAAEPAVGIGDNCGIGMPQVRQGIDVVNRGGNVGSHNVNIFPGLYRQRRRKARHGILVAGCYSSSL
jgi:hypothetical protein